MNRIPVLRCQLVREREHATEEPDRIGAPGDVYRLAQEYLDGADREHFGVLLLNTLHRIIGIHTVTIGVLNGSLVHPREVFKPAILGSAAALILFHNHPSGDPTPSGEDRKVTRQLVKAGQVIGIPVLDHVIIGDGRYHSFQESGDLDGAGS